MQSERSSTELHHLLPQTHSVIYYYHCRNLCDSGQANDMPTAFRSTIMPLGTNDTWVKWKILNSGRF